MSDCVLAVDVGSTSLKAGLIERDGTVAAMCSMPYSAPENRFVAEGWIWALKGAVDKLVALRQAQGSRVYQQHLSAPKSILRQQSDFQERNTARCK